MLTDKVEELVSACENAWSWYCRSLSKKCHATSKASKTYWTEQVEVDSRKHSEARAALTQHLAELILHGVINEQPEGDEDPSRA